MSTGLESRVIIVESEIGGGKSTLLPALAAGLTRRGYRAIVVEEPVSEWKGVLEKFYADPVRWAYSFQTLVYVTRIRAIRRAFEEATATSTVTSTVMAPDTSTDMTTVTSTNASHASHASYASHASHASQKLVFVLERSPLTDEIFMELQRGIVSDAEMDMYEVWRREFAPLLPFDLSTAAVLYLKPDLATCMRRVATRQRAGETESGAESGVTLVYQARLRRAHEALLQGLHADEFPRLVARPPPYPRSAVSILSAELAELNFRDPGAAQDLVVGTALDMLGFSIV